MRNGAFIIFMKDMREALRNRRTLVRMLVLPGVILPLIGHYFLWFTGKNREDLDKSVLTYAVQGGQYLPDLANLYAKDSNFRRVDIGDQSAEMAVRNGTVRFALEIPTDAKEKLRAGQGVNVKFVYYRSDPGEAVVEKRGTAPLIDYSKRQRDWRLVFLGVANEDARSHLLDPVSYQAVNVATDRERIGYGLGGVIAYALLLLCFMGCSFAAVDLVAGEKERGTLEILVMLPTPRHQIILGKFMVIFLFGLAYATLSAISLSGWLAFETMDASAQLKNVIGQIGPLDIFSLWLMLIPVAVLSAAVVLAISVYARSYREASNLTGFANMMESLLITVVFVPGVSLNWLWALIPVSNLGLMIREFTQGTLNNAGAVASIMTSTLVIGTVLLVLATTWFRKESVIYRE